jgi:hypothetical protein
MKCHSRNKVCKSQNFHFKEQTVIRINLYSPGEPFPPHGLAWVESVGDFVAYDDLAGKPIPARWIVIAHTRRYNKRKRRNVGRWIAANYERIMTAWRRAKHA